MDKNTTTKVRWFWAWQDEDEESWLGSMARSGWHLASFGFPGIYRFKSGEPGDVVYRLDYNSPRRENRQEYFQLFSDAGWEYIGKFGAWQYFRKTIKTGEESEIFTDRISKAEKYRRQLAYLTTLLPVMILLVIRWGDNDPPYPWWWVVRITGFGLYILYLFSMIKILRRIQYLKKG
jgi:hypothetical protein